MYYTVYTMRQGGVTTNWIRPLCTHLKEIITTSSARPQLRRGWWPLPFHCGAEMVTTEGGRCPGKWENSDVRTQSWLCKWKTNKVAQTEALTIPANQYWVSGAQKGGVEFDWLLRILITFHETISWTASLMCSVCHLSIMLCDRVVQ